MRSNFGASHAGSMLLMSILLCTTARSWLAFSPISLSLKVMITSSLPTAYTPVILRASGSVSWRVTIPPMEDISDDIASDITDDKGRFILESPSQKLLLLIWIFLSVKSKRDLISCVIIFEALTMGESTLTCSVRVETQAADDNAMRTGINNVWIEDLMIFLISITVFYSSPIVLLC